MAGARSEHRRTFITADVFGQSDASKDQKPRGSFFISRKSSSLKERRIFSSHRKNFLERLSTRNRISPTSDTSSLFRSRWALFNSCRRWRINLRACSGVSSKEDGIVEGSSPLFRAPASHYVIDMFTQHGKIVPVRKIVIPSQRFV